MFLICSFFPSDISLIFTYFFSHIFSHNSYFFIPVTSANSLILLKKCFHCPFLFLSLFFLHPSLCCLNFLSISCHFSSLPERVSKPICSNIYVTLWVCHYCCKKPETSVLAQPLTESREKHVSAQISMPESTRPITHTQMCTDQVPFFNSQIDLSFTSANSQILTVCYWDISDEVHTLRKAKELTVGRWE